MSDAIKSPRQAALEAQKKGLEESVIALKKASAIDGADRSATVAEEEEVIAHIDEQLSEIAAGKPTS